jgi:hypothetical protein
LRLWISGFEPFVLLAPMVTWAAPASVPETYLLEPSVAYCARRLEWTPDILLGDMGYINHAAKHALRTRWQVAVLTRMKANMQRWCDYTPKQPLRCEQGQELQWLGYDEADGQHWFGPPEGAPLCPWCWQKSQCPRQFAIPAQEHETFFGMIPLNTALAWRLNHSVRSWIEGAQSFEKNQLGLKTIFLNSLSLCWTVSLLADAVALLRALAILQNPPSAKHLLEPLLPTQGLLPLEESEF